MLIHPKHWVELDTFSKDRSNVGPVVGLDTEIVNHDGEPTSICVVVGDDKRSAKWTLHRIARIWNLMRDVPDDQLNDVVVVSKSQVRAVMEHLQGVINETLEPLETWAPEGRR